MWDDSSLEEQLKAILNEGASVAAEQPRPAEGISSTRYYLYGDLAYWPAFGIMGPIRPQNQQGILSREEKAASLAMSSVRISVEWGFGMNANLWGINNYKRGSKVMFSPVAALYMVSTLLTNIRTCMDGDNQVSEKFQLPPTYHTKKPLHTYIRKIIRTDYCTDYFMD